MFSPSFFFDLASSPVVFALFSPSVQRAFSAGFIHSILPAAGCSYISNRACAAQRGGHGMAWHHFYQLFFFFFYYTLLALQVHEIHHGRSQTGGLHGTLFTRAVFWIFGVVVTFFSRGFLQYLPTILAKNGSDACFYGHSFFLYLHTSLVLFLFLRLCLSLTYGVITEHTLGWLCAFLWCVLESSKMQNFLHKKRLQRSGRLITVFAKNARLFLHFQAQHSRKSPHHFESAYQQTRTVIFSLRGYFGRHWRSRIRSTNESSGIWKEGCRVGSTESRVFSAGQSLSSYENSGEVS
jgi:hypothetical protein